jgi:PAS domain S-box-containing protein
MKTNKKIKKTLKNKKYNIITNPYIGPIIVLSLIILIIIGYTIPNISHENKIIQLKNKAISSVDRLKKIRAYYTANIVKKVKAHTNLKINYDHMLRDDTIPLPATLLHNLSEILPQNGIKIQMFSNYPFPNRANRVLNDYQKKSLQWIEKNPYKTYVNLVTQDNKKVLKVTVADIFYDPECVKCHNTRADTPKANWKLGDVRGVIEVTLPFINGVVLTSDQTASFMVAFIILLIILGIHYTYISLKKDKEHLELTNILEEEIKDRTKSLLKANSFLGEYKKAIDHSTIVSKTNAKGIITYVNDEFIAMSQYSKEELIGKNHNVVRHPDMPSSAFKELWDTIKAKKIWKGQIKNRAKDGSSYYVSSTIVPILDHKGDIKEFLGIRLDITDIIEAQLQAQKADIAKSSFLANMSHEIRTPLNAIIGFSDVLNSSTSLSLNHKKHASIIQSSANSLLSIINDILDVSKIESGSFQVELQNTDLYHVLEQVVELFAQKASQKAIKLIFNIDNKIPTCIITDGIRIRQVISNLLNNAIKFTPEFGTIEVNIEVIDINSTNAKVRFKVIDDGIGIPEDKVDTIFQPFMQVDNHSNRKYEGTGLGLSICTHIIEALGSKIDIKSKVGSGTTFWFDLDFEICNESINERISSSHKLNFKITDDQSQLYHYAKRYLDIFGNTAQQEDDQADVLVCTYEKKNNEIIKSCRVDHPDMPKLILFNSDEDSSSAQLEENEIAISLPFYPSKINDALQELVQTSHHIETSSKQKQDTQDKFIGNILVAEDNSANQALISYVLESLGVKYDIADNGQIAVDCYKENQYDLVLMDINMPVMDGIDAFKTIREYENQNGLRSVPIIALTANAIKGDREKFLSLGMTEYLSKPLEVEKLKKVFSDYLLIDDTIVESLQDNIEDVQVVDNTKIDQNDTQNTQVDQELEEENYNLVLDPAIVAKTLGLSENIGKMLINKFKKDIVADIDELEEYINKNDSLNIKSKAHYIKNSCLNIGLAELVEILQLMETQTTDIQVISTNFKKLKKMILSIL